MLIKFWFLDISMAADARFSRFLIVGFVMVAVYIGPVHGDRCYTCITEQQSLPQCTEMANFTLDCVTEINEPGCDSGEHRYVDIRYTYFYPNGTYVGGGSLKVPDCVDDGIRNNIFPASPDICVSEKTLKTEFQKVANGLTLRSVATDERLELGTVNGTVCYCQTSQCTEGGPTTVPSSSNGMTETTPAGNSAESRKTPGLLFVNLICTIMMGCKIWHS